MNESDQGPVYLGYRLGHIQRRQPRVPRARLQQGRRGAAHAAAAGRRRGVLRGRAALLQRPRGSRRPAPTISAQAMETAAGRPLDRFFDQWIYGSTLPRLKVSYRVEGAEVVVRTSSRSARSSTCPSPSRSNTRTRTSADVVIPVTEPVDGPPRPAGRRARRTSRSARTTARSPRSSRD